MPSPAKQPTNRLLVWISWLELILGAFVVLLGFLLYVAWATDHSGHGERAFLLVGAYFMVPVGLAFVIAGYLLRHGAAWAQWIVPIVLITQFLLLQRLPHWPWALP